MRAARTALCNIASTRSIGPPRPARAAGGIAASALLSVLACAGVDGTGGEARGGRAAEDDASFADDARATAHAEGPRSPATEGRELDPAETRDTIRIRIAEVPDAYEDLEADSVAARFERSGDEIIFANLELRPAELRNFSESPPRVRAPAIYRRSGDEDFAALGIISPRSRDIGPAAEGEAESDIYGGYEWKSVVAAGEGVVAALDWAVGSPGRRVEVIRASWELENWRGIASLEKIHYTDIVQELAARGDRRWRIEMRTDPDIYPARLAAERLGEATPLESYSFQTDDAGERWRAVPGRHREE